MRVEVLMAWSRRHRSVVLELPVGACVADALAAAALDPDGQAGGVAVYGVLATPATRLEEGDRVELLRPLLLDPKEARRRRARR
ncbi:MAG: RnfH family protein [Pseudoxanthomonas sp.]